MTPLRFADRNSVAQLVESRLRQALRGELLKVGREGRGTLNLELWARSVSRPSTGRSR